MKKSELLRALQTEIQKHNLSTFMREQHKEIENLLKKLQRMRPSVQ